MIGGIRPHDEVRASDEVRPHDRAHPHDRVHPHDRAHPHDDAHPDRGAFGRRPHDGGTAPGAGGGDAAGRAARVLPWRRPDTGLYDDAFRRAIAGAVAAQPRIEGQRAAAGRAAASLLHHEPRRRDLLLRNHPGFGGWWLAALLADEAEQCNRARGRSATPATAGGSAVELATLATEVAGRLDGEPAALIEDVTARSWRALADARRAGGDLEAAADALARARRHLRRGTGEPLERAALLESTGLLLAARGRHRARTLLALAAAVYARLEEVHLEGRVRLALGLLEEEPRRAAMELRRGLDRLESDAEPELAARGRRRLAELLPCRLPPSPPPVHPALRPALP